MAPEVLELVPVGHMQFSRKILPIKTSAAWKAGEVCRKSRAKFLLLCVLATAALLIVPLGQRSTRILLMVIQEQSSAHIGTGANKIFLSRKCPNLEFLQGQGSFAGGKDTLFSFPAYLLPQYSTGAGRLGWVCKVQGDS